MKKILLLITCSFVFVSSFCQTYSTSADIYLGLRKLNVLGSVLYIAAHPDDENTRLLTYFSKDRLYRTGYLALTRGDGGQNLIGDEQGVELGLIRTQELLAARRIDGAEQFFSRAFDFGYSKTPQETFTKWDKEKILSDVVWVIRNFQPDVIITRFPTTGEGGHGHHTASAILANEAFTAAADPKRFPEQLKYVQPWQAKRILLNGFNFGGQNTITADQLRLDVGGYNPILGKSYGEIAAESRSQHKSQGFGSARSRGEAFEFFRTTGGSTPSNDLFEDVDVSWKRVKGGDKLQQMINSAIASFDFMQPQKLVPQLVEIYKALNALPQSYWRDQKLKEVKALVEGASGLWIEAFTNQQYAVQGDSVRINFVLNDRLGVGAKLNEIIIDRFDSSLILDLPKNRNFSLVKSMFVPATKEITQPYWLQNKMQEGYFNVTNQQMIGRADIQPAYEVTYKLTIGGEQFSFVKPLRYKFSDQVKGEIYWPVVVLPGFEIEQMNDVVKATDDNNFQIDFRVVSNTRHSTLPFTVQVLPSGFNSSIKDVLPQSNSRGSIKEFSKTDHKLFDSWQKSLNTHWLNANKNEENLVFEPEGKDSVGHYSYYSKSIIYDHIPAITYFKVPTFYLLKNDIKTYNKRIGYIIGAGDKVPEALEQMGYEVTLLTEKELARNNLQQYDVIMTGVRAFNTNDWMPKYYDKLMKYIENGGNYIVQYSQTNNLRGGKMGPYNFSVVNKRITDENAAVTFLKPEHPVLNFPNRITQDDFKGWVQERSTYHADRLDYNFQTILRMNDPDERPDDGALVIAKYGKGYFTYTGLVFFRELPAGVPGAYRLLANIIALNRKKEF
jgi:LmbE family N-acetylglucosaminyl deacetylase